VIVRGRLTDGWDTCSWLLRSRGVGRYIVSERRCDMMGSGAAGSPRSTSRGCSPRAHQVCFLFFFNDTSPTEFYTLSLHDALPISGKRLFLRVRIFQIIDEPMMVRFRTGRRGNLNRVKFGHLRRQPQVLHGVTRLVLAELMR